MNKHIIYIPTLGQDSIFSQQLAHAFAKYHIDFDTKDSSTILMQYGSKLKPLELVTPSDTLQIIFTPINNISSPLHGQTGPEELITQVPILINHLLQDGLDPNGRTIQLYTLEHTQQDINIIKEIAKQLVVEANIKNLLLEWHVIPKLTQLSPEEINKIFLPNFTCQATLYSVQNNGETEIAEAYGLYIRSNTMH